MKPTSKVQKYLEAIQNGIVSNLPKPVTKVEQYLYKIALNGGSGSGGTSGKDGLSAYELAKQEGYDGTLTEWLESLKGEQGEQGIPGQKGDKGDIGEKGTDGFSPTAIVTQTEIGAVITITDVNGTTTANVKNGENSDGSGHTHVNKTVLDEITAEKIVEWDTKLDADNSIGKLYPGSTHGEIFNDYENNKATGTYSAAMGTRCTANGNCSFSMGAGCTTSGYNSIAMGGGCTTNGNCSFTMGGSCIASGDYSHAEGQNTKASSLNQHVQGKYNVEDTEGKYAFVIGNGISENERSNAIAIDWSGNIYVNNSEIGVNVLDMSNLLNDISERTITLETSNNNWGDYSPSHNTYPLACETHYIESEKYSGKKTFAVEIRTSSEENNAIRLSPNGIYVEDLSPQIQALETSIGDIQTVLASIVEVAR